MKSHHRSFDHHPHLVIKVRYGREGKRNFYCSRASLNSMLNRKVFAALAQRTGRTGKTFVIKTFLSDGTEDGRTKGDTGRNHHHHFLFRNARVLRSHLHDGALNARRPGEFGSRGGITCQSEIMHYTDRCAVVTSSLLPLSKR